MAERALAIDPASAAALDTRGRIREALGAFDLASADITRALELDPSYFYAADFLGRAYEQVGRKPDALAAYQQAVELDRENAENWSNLGHAYAVSGHPAQARQIINDLKATAARSYVGPFNIALIYAGLGDKDQAFAWLERAYEDGSALLILYMGNDARWDRLRADPRYVSLARRIGLPPPAPGRRGPDLQGPEVRETGQRGPVVRRASAQPTARRDACAPWSARKGRIAAARPAE